MLRFAMNIMDSVQYKAKKNFKVKIQFQRKLNFTHRNYLNINCLG